MKNHSVTIFGEVLFDRFADGVQVLGGAPFNVAWHLQAFAQQPLFVSSVGRDSGGENILKLMQAWDMDLSAMQIDAQHVTGTVVVSIDNGEPHYEILSDQAYDFVSAEQLPDVTGCKLLYHGSLALRNKISADALTTLKSRHDGLVFMDVNLRAPWWDKNQLMSWVAGADWVKLNQQELDCLQPDKQSLIDRMRQFIKQYGLQGLIVTSGEQGAMAIGADLEPVSVRPSRVLQVVDTVGAGDAFAAVLIVGITQSWPLSLTMQRAQDFASAVVEQRGAVISDEAVYQKFCQAWF